MWQSVSNFLGYTDEITEEERLENEHKHAKNLSLASSQHQNLLNQLQKSIQELNKVVSNNHSINSNAATMESTDDSKKFILNDNIPAVTKVCEHIDYCFSHGLRTIEDDKDAHVQFFGILKWTAVSLSAIQRQRMVNGLDEAGSANLSKHAYQLATSTLKPKVSREDRGFMTCVRTANSLASVTTDEGKARAFIRQALNLHILYTSFTSILDPENVKLLASYYTEYALFRNIDAAKIFLSNIQNLDSMTYGFMIDDMRLDILPTKLPFSEPLPSMVPQKINVKPPKLIDPEDMIDGRVRLISTTGENSILAEKLVSHRHLGKKYNSTSGGNPLVNILKKTQIKHYIDDFATSMMRYFELGYPEYQVFGTSLEKVVQNPFICGMARFDQRLGLPDVMEACICFLHRKLATPGLFQVHLSPEHVMDIHDAIEELGGFHKSMLVDPHEVVAILLQYLWELPNPLFSHELWESFVACGHLPDREQRITNLKRLFNDLPSSNKALVERLFHLFSRAVEPQFSQKSGITIETLALLLSPIVLRDERSLIYNEWDNPSQRRYEVVGHTPIRNRLPLNAYGQDNFYEAKRVASELEEIKNAKAKAEEGAMVLEELIREQGTILQEYREELSHYRKILQDKVERMEGYRQRLGTKIDITNEKHVLLLKKLWDGLLTCPNDENDFTTFSSKSVKELLKSPRWRRSGFHTSNPIGGFRGGGLLSLEIMAFFVNEYPDKAKDMMLRNSEPGGNRYPFPVACINVMRMLLELTMVDEPPETTSRLVMRSSKEKDIIIPLKVAERVSRTPFWRTFDDELSFEKMHGMAFMILDLHWTRSEATQMGFAPVLDSTRQQIGWLLEQGPKSIEEMWRSWMKVREQEACTVDNIQIACETKTLTEVNEKLPANINERPEIDF